MKLPLRARALGKKFTLIFTAYVLAVSSLTASVPFILSKEAGAVNPKGCTTEFSATYQACVTNLDQLQAALDNKQISQIILDDTIYTTSTVVIDRPVMLNGHDEKIVFTNDTTGWQGNYVLQVYNTTGVSLNSVQLEGGDAGVYVNGSEVVMSGNMGFVNHEFGNVELAKGQNVIRAPKLTIASQGVLGGNRNETEQKPFAWVDTNSVSDAVINGGYLYKGINRSLNTDNKAQLWFYSNPNNTGVVADIEQTGAVFGSVQEAIDAAAAGQTVRLQKDVTVLDTAIRINKHITFEGNAKTITAPTVRGSSGDNKNTAIVVTASGATVKNVSVVSTFTSNPRHGIVVQGSSAITDVTLQNISTKGATAGLILNNSTVIVDGVSTNGSLWYGIGVDKGAKLTITGSNSHTEVVAIKNDSTAISTVVDQNGQYITAREHSSAGKMAYTLANAAPTATVTVNGVGSGSSVSDREAAEPAIVEGAAMGISAIKSHWFEITAPNGKLYYWSNMNTSNPNVSFVLNEVNGLPLDSKGRAKEGQYTIRYVATDVNKVRNDDRAPSIIKVVVDNTKPQIAATMSNQFVVSDNNLPTLTINATDANGVKEVQYEILRADDLNGKAVVGWTTAPNQTSVPLTVLSSVSDGSYVLRVRGFDNADNKQSGVDVPFTINRTITSAVSVSNLASTTPTLNGVAYYANDTVAANEELSVTVDGVLYPTVTTDEDGMWTVPVVVTSGKHQVQVTRINAGLANPVVANTTFTTVLIPTVPVNNGDSDQNEDEEDAAASAGTDSGSNQTVNGGLPFATFGTAGVLGLGDDATSDSDTDDTDNADVEGISTANTLAAAVDNTDGKAFGLAWYWWLLIVAAVAGVIWWIVNAVRNRQAE